MREDGVVGLIEDRSLTTDEVGLMADLITDEPDHYTVLGVSPDASREEIQAAYCLAVECFHPTKRRKITESDSVMHWKLSSAFLRIEEAFTVLSRRGRREVYDDTLRSQNGDPVRGPKVDSRQPSLNELAPAAGTPLAEAHGVREEMRG